MTRVQTLLAVCLVSVVAGAHLAAASDDPSPLAQEIPGARGTIVFKPSDWTPGETTWWQDSDGVKPGIQGCHIGTDSSGTPNGRMFGEACLENGLLVETNPVHDKLHSHSNDVGYPDTFDCNTWCIGEGNASGSCQAAAAPPCEQSARCVCE
jgi:hypothetical protein